MIKCKMKYINTKHVSVPVKRKMSYMHKKRKRKKEKGPGWV